MVTTLESFKRHLPDDKDLNVDPNEKKKLKSQKVCANEEIIREVATEAETDCLNVVTFVVKNRNNFSIEALTSHEIKPLVDVLYDTYQIYGDETGDHWILEDCIACKSYKSRGRQNTVGDLEASKQIGAEIKVTFDDSKAEDVFLKVISIKAATNNEKQMYHPRPTSFLPDNFQIYNPGPDAPNMDKLYPSLSKFLKLDQDQTALYLFQPGRRNHHALIERNELGRTHYIYAPERFESVELLFSGLDEACRNFVPVMRRPWDGYTIFPSDFTANVWTARSAQRFTLMTSGRHRVHSVVKAQDPIYRTHYQKILDTFPKVAAAAGYSKGRPTSKDKDRGWMIYKANTLTLCRGFPAPRPKKKSASP